MNAIPDTLPALLAQRVNSVTPALIDRGRPVSFRELAGESRCVAQGLRRLGVRPGDCIALWLPNVPAWLAAFFACAQLGAIAVSVNTRFRSHELADILQRARARILIFWPEFKGIDFSGILAACDPRALEHLKSVVVYGEAGTQTPASVLGRTAHSYMLLAGGAPLLENSAAPDAGCAIFTTSGTTKAPKFVLHDQRTVLAHASDVAGGFSLTDDSVLLLVPPLCGVFGFCSAMAALCANRPMVMAPAWDADQAARDIVAHRVTHINGTDEAAAQLLDASGEPFSNIRFFGYAAFNPAQADIVQRADARDLRLVGLYGASEIQALFARQDETAPVAERMLGGGRPVSPAARVRVRDPESGSVLAHGVQGELEFFAPSSRMAGYHGNPDATGEAFTADGYYRSGDLGYTRADGRFIYLARIGDALRLGGFLVSPAEIEAVVQEAPGVAACQVVGVPGAAGLVPVAFVVLHHSASLDEAAVIARVAGKLARYKVPVRVFAIDAFPVTPGANATKIQKGKLREMAEALLH
ncbi:MAG TPA: AMP-binding protein [Burkholderiales bacterium]|nr:AMP-binding protein [Burkholderiales bacterium]